MNKAIKGAVLSGLVLPGLGQLVLKHYLRGALLLLASLASLAFLVQQATERAMAILAGSDLLNLAIDPAALPLSIDLTAGGESGELVGVASTVLLIIWLGGTVDAYLLGRQEDMRRQGERPGR